MISPLYKNIAKTLKDIKKGDEPLPSIEHEEEFERIHGIGTIDYLIENEFIKKESNSIGYQIMTKGNIFLENNKRVFRRIESQISDYPTLLGGIIGTVIGGLITRLFTK